ncbi:MAG TPA: hypothetical protein VKB80_14260 [Kofleriaceae bacterium]|nr:hypothetical protein [Kofleriaceae bacterium]
MTSASFCRRARPDAGNNTVRRRCCGGAEPENVPLEIARMEIARMEMARMEID